MRPRPEIEKYEELERSVTESPRQTSTIAYRVLPSILGFNAILAGYVCSSNDMSTAGLAKTLALYTGICTAGGTKAGILHAKNQTIREDVRDQIDCMRGGYEGVRESTERTDLQTMMAPETRGYVGKCALLANGASIAGFAIGYGIGSFVR